MNEKISIIIPVYNLEKYKRVMLIVLYWNIKEYMVELNVEKRMKQVRESLQYQSIVWRRIWTRIIY